jgi:hypothetical protein
VNLEPEVNLARINNGEALIAPRKKDVQKKANIARLVGDYTEGSQHGQQTRLEFLEGLASIMVLSD